VALVVAVAGSASASVHFFLSLSLLSFPTSSFASIQETELPKRRNLVQNKKIFGSLWFKYEDKWSDHVYLT
jgi:hypothetical protein